MSNKREFNRFDKKKNQKKLWLILWSACAISVLLELFVGHRHGHFRYDEIFGFYAVLGFLACAVSIFIAVGLGRFLKVDEHFYVKDNHKDDRS